METAQERFVEVNHLITINVERHGSFDPRQWFVRGVSKDAVVKIEEVSENFQRLMAESGIEEPKAARIMPVLVGRSISVFDELNALFGITASPYLQFSQFLGVLISWGEPEVRVPEEHRPLYRFFMKPKGEVWEVHFERGRKGWIINANRRMVFGHLSSLEPKDVLLCALPPG